MEEVFQGEAFQSLKAIANADMLAARVGTDNSRYIWWMKLFKNEQKEYHNEVGKSLQDANAEEAIQRAMIEAGERAQEEEAQKSYEDMVRDTNKAIDEANADLTNKKAAKGKAESDKAEAEVALEANMSELELLANKSNDLHSSCDFMMKNFDIRQSRRDDEMEALKSA